MCVSLSYPLHRLQLTSPCADILDVIGAGASAKSDKDWASLWNESEESKKVQREIDQFHAEKEGEASAADKSPDAGLDYAAPRWQQFTVVLRRTFQHYNRDPTCPSLSPFSSASNRLSTDLSAL